MTPWHIALAGGATATCRPRSPGARFFVCVFLEMRTLAKSSRRRPRRFYMVGAAQLTRRRPAEHPQPTDHGTSTVRFRTTLLDSPQRGTSVARRLL